MKTATAIMLFDAVRSIESHAKAKFNRETKYCKRERERERENI